MLPSYAADGVLDPPEEWGGDGEHEEGDEEVLVDPGPRHLQRPDKKDLLENHLQEVHLSCDTTNYFMHFCGYQKIYTVIF